MNWELIMLHESFGFTLLHSLAVDLFFSFLFLLSHLLFKKVSSSSQRASDGALSAAHDF